MKYLYIAAIFILTTCSPSRSQVKVGEISEKDYDEVEVAQKSSDKESEDETLSPKKKIESPQTLGVEENSQGKTKENHHNNDPVKPPKVSQAGTSKNIDGESLQGVNHGAADDKYEENGASESEEDIQDDGDEIEEDIEEDIEEEETSEQLDSSAEEDGLTLDDKISLFRKDIQGDEENITFNLIYNPLGYSLSIPTYFIKSLQDNHLWYLKHTRKSNYELQFIIGVSQDKEELHKLLDRVTNKYAMSGKIHWKTPSRLNDGDLHKANALEGMESSSIKQTLRYHNILGIKVLRNKSETMTSFIVGILSLKKGMEDFDSRLKGQKKIFMKVFYSFTFL